jgi:hypothetical protein
MLAIFRRLHNYLTPVEKLPDEILCTIFESTCDISSNKVRDALIISNVCKRWRDTAISLSPIWTDIRIPSTSSAHEMCLECSKNSPLNVALKIPEGEYGVQMSDNISENIQLLAEHHDRINSIEIDAPDGYGSLLSHLDFTVPRLETFTCLTRRNVGGNAIFDFLLPNTFKLFSGRMPSLRSVSLTSLTPNGVGGFNNLVKIRLSTRLEGSWRESAFFEFLQRLGPPLLECLEISEYRFVQDRSGRSVVPLPKLTEMSLSDTQSRFILSYLDTPNILQLTVST